MRFLLEKNIAILPPLIRAIGKAAKKNSTANSINPRQTKKREKQKDTQINELEELGT
jgi:hypothetical protein